MATLYESIENEKISSLVFPKSDVLSKNEAILQRISELKLALSFGNLDYFKIKIYFEDNLSKKVVEAKVCGVTNKRVILTHGIGIPINRIYRTFKFYN
ncbi:hypothetical protein [Flavobacterium sp.]|jgi:predicted phosphodiesterase|uniref:hypothetical protein n=1 Tax=Flavobacterium sp. TaxID=239 RepID=UPI0037C0092F